MKVNIQLRRRIRFSRSKILHLRKPARNTSVFYLKIDPQETNAMTQIIAVNKDGLYIPGDNGEAAMNGDKARNLVQATTWRPLARTGWRAD
jgi:hypothetical protein